MTFITSNKWLRAGYGKKSREFFLKYNPTKLIDLGSGIFESATVDSNILTIQKSLNKNKLKAVVLSKSEKTTDFTNLDFVTLKNLSSDVWAIADENEQNIKLKIEKIGTPLKEWDINIYRGILTGFNEAFIIDENTKNELIKKDQKSEEIIKPILRGRDIRKYEINFAKLYLINSHNNPPVDIEKYPAIKEHLDSYYPQLEKRGDKGKTPYNLRNCAYLEEFQKEKIFWAEMTKEACFNFDDENFFINQTCYFSTDLTKYHLAILNSKLVYFYFSNISNNLGEGAFRWIKQFVEQIPIPKIEQNRQKPFKILVDYIIYLKKEKKENYIIEFFERVIDIAVYELYFKEELHSKGFGILEVLESELIPFDNSFETIDKVYKKLSDKNHKVAYNVNFIDTLDIVKTIENK